LSALTAGKWLEALNWRIAHRAMNPRDAKECLPHIFFVYVSKGVNEAEKGSNCPFLLGNLAK
jgi:hypothetical protein